MFCYNCGFQVPEDATFCPNCGTRIVAAQPPTAQAPAAPEPQSQQGFIPQQQPVGAQPQPAHAAQHYAAPTPAPAPVIPENVVPKGMLVGKREIPTNRAFTHEELLQFMQERWDSSTYSSIITDSSLKRYTDLYVVLPATARYKIIVYSRGGGPFSRGNKVVLSYIPSSSGSTEMILRGIPTRSVIFGIAKISATMDARAEREGPLEQVLQKYADYMHYLLGQAGYLA